MTEATQAGLYNLEQPTPLAYAQGMLEAKKFKRKGKETGEPKFGGTLVFEKDAADLKAIQKLAIKIAKAKFPDKTQEELRAMKWPWQDGDKAIANRAKNMKKEGKEPNDNTDFMAGKVILKLSSKFPVRLAGFKNGKTVDYEGDLLKASKGEFYHGVKCLVQMNLVAYDGVDDGPDGVTAYPNLVLTTNKGEKLKGAGGPSAAEVFKGYAGSASEEDPTAGDPLDDGISF